MTDEQFFDLYEKAKVFYGDKMEDPESNPRTFAYQIRLMVYEEQLNDFRNRTQDTSNPEVVDFTV